MKKVELKGIDINELAAYLDGEKVENVVLNSIQDGDELVFENKEYVLKRPLNIRRALKLTGNGAHIKGDNCFYGIMVYSGDVTVSDFKITDFDAILEVDPFGKEIENILIEKIDYIVKYSGIQAASSRSNGVLRNITIQDCVAHSKGHEWEGSGLQANLPITVYAAAGRADGTKEINNCLVEHAYILRNKAYGQYRTMINVTCAMAAEFSLTSYQGTYDHCKVKDVHMNDNWCELAWDGPYNVTCEFMNASHSAIEDVEIAGNSGGFGIVGIYLFGGESCWSSTYGAQIRNIKIHHNNLHRGVADVGEPSRGMHIVAARCDYFEHTHFNDAIMENVEVYENTIDGAGIVLIGAYSMLDGDVEMSGNTLKNVKVHHNKILNCEKAFEVYAAQNEGRRVDWNFGYPRHDNTWLPELEDDSTETVRFTGNKIINLEISDNEVEGYRYRCWGVAAEGRGHAIYKDNKCVEGIVWKNNKFTHGEAHVHVADYTYDDFSKDLGGNEIYKGFLNK